MAEELGKVVQVLLEKDPSCLPVAHLPLYRPDDGAALDASMPIFNERGLMPPQPSQPPSTPVPVSSGEHSEEEEEGDSEPTLEGVGETSPPR